MGRERGTPSVRTLYLPTRPTLQGSGLVQVNW